MCRLVLILGSEHQRQVVLFQKQLRLVGAEGK